MDQERIDSLKSYIQRHEAHLDQYMLPLIDPAGKRILVLGSGWGTETYWALQRKATYVLGVDPAERSTMPLLSSLDPALHKSFVHKQGTISALPTESFDAVISNNVFEHVFDLAGTMRDCKRFMPKKGSRLCIFTDPLFFSSCGAHLRVDPWAHLTESQISLKERGGG